LHRIASTDFSIQSADGYAAKRTATFASKIAAVIQPEKFRNSAIRASVDVGQQTRDFVALCR
jgi:hypothetical protein